MEAAFGATHGSGGGFSATSARTNKQLTMSAARMSMGGGGNGKWSGGRESPMLQIFIRPKAKGKRPTVIVDNNEKI